MQRRIDALQIVESRRGNITVPFHARLRIVHKQVCGQDVLRRDAERVRDPRAQRFGIRVTVKREQIDRRVQLCALVHRAIHVDRHIRNHRHRHAQVAEPRGNAAIRADDHAPRHRKRAVKPGREDHPAVGFDRKLGVVRRLQVGVFLDLRRGAVAVRRRDHKAVESRRRAERDHRGRAAADKIALARLERPCVGLGKPGVPCRRQRVAHGRRRMVRRRAVRNKIKQCRVFHRNLRYSVM